jgi:hypothetical protein
MKFEWPAGWSFPGFAFPNGEPIPDDLEYFLRCYVLDYGYLPTAIVWSEPQCSIAKTPLYGKFVPCIYVYLPEVCIIPVYPTSAYMPMRWHLLQDPSRHVKWDVKQQVEGVE